MLISGTEPMLVALAARLDDEAFEVAFEDTRRLIVACRLGPFVRKFPLTWGGRRYLFDFCFEPFRTILETNGRRWHDDPLDYEADNEKWSVPGRHGYKLVLATWSKVTEHPAQLIAELEATFRA